MIEGLNFSAIDFETATFDRMACQIGITIVENGEIVDTIVKLIQPPKNFYNEQTINVHHITPFMTKDAPTFNIVWDEISKYIENRVLVAHNAKFDYDVLMRNLDYYDIWMKPIPKFYCTLEIWGYSLENLCQAFSIDCKEHHDAGFDAECCAIFYINYKSGIKPNLDLIKTNTKNNNSHMVFRNKRHEQLHGDILQKDLTNADPCNPFYDRKVVITGLFPIDRKIMANKLKAMGADLDSSITKKTNYVIIGEDAGPAKLDKLDKLEHDGFKIHRLNYYDYERIISGECDDKYITEKETVKDLDFSMDHYLMHHLEFNGMENKIASKEIYFGKNLKGNPLTFYQITGNLGAYANWILSSDVNLCVLSNYTLEKLKQGIKDETIQYIQDYYNNNKSITFNFDFMSEQDILDWCKMRCDKIGDQVTLNLYNNYINNK